MEIGYNLYGIYGFPKVLEVVRRPAIWKGEKHSFSYSRTHHKLASFKEDQRPNRCNAASHMGAAVWSHVVRSGRLDAALR